MEKKLYNTGIIFGAFDLCHAGHLLAFSQAKALCEHLIVGLHTDPSTERPEKNSPIETMLERWIRVESCELVDQIIPYSHESDITKILTIAHPDVRFLGEDYIDKPFTGEKLCEDMQIDINYLNRFDNLSSTELRERIKNA